MEIQCDEEVPFPESRHFYSTNKLGPMWGSTYLAEREGFEPPNRFPRLRISSAVPSTTRPSLQNAHSTKSPARIQSKGWTMRALGWMLAGLVVVLPVRAQAPELALTDAAADRFAALALRCADQEYPNKLDHVINGPQELQSPRVLHPAFYGCFDWHSSVHGHWMLVKLLREHPGMARAAEIRALLDAHLNPESIGLEVAYLGQPNRRSFERTYGWAWLLKLAAELHSSGDPDCQRWFAALKPLADAVSVRYAEFLPKQTYPIRTGVHPNTAFGLAFALDYALEVGDLRFSVLLVQRAQDYFLKDRDYPAAWEPSSEDFFSPALLEADLMRRALKTKEFPAWFHKFLPKLPKNILTPATVTDRSDPRLVHLDGLNLSRAWAMRDIAAALPPKDPSRKLLSEAAARHAADALANVASGHYEGEHWLATFAVYMLSTPQP